MKSALITSRDPKGQQATNLFEAAYNKAKLDEAKAGLLNVKDGEFQAGIIKLINELTMSNQYANEEVISSYTYPPEYKGPKPIKDQIMAIAKLCDLDPTQALACADNLPQLDTFVSADALPWTGWFAVPSPQAIAAKQFPDITDSTEWYAKAVQLILDMIEKSRPFTNCRKGAIDKAHLRVHTRTVEAMAKLAEQQPGDIWIIAAQLGRHHRGRSPRRARECFADNEYGLTSLMAGSIILTHPERLVRFSELDMDCPGDEFAPVGDGVSSRAPVFGFCGWAEFDAFTVGSYNVDYGSASGFLPQ